MIRFLRKWYALAAVVWFLGVLAAMILFPWKATTFHPALFWAGLLAMIIVPATLLASRGLNETTTTKVLGSIYACIAVPTGLFALYADAVNNTLQGWVNSHWLNTWVWFQLILEGGFLAAPVILIISFATAILVNWLATVVFDGLEVAEPSLEKKSAPSSMSPHPPAATLRQTVADMETPTIFLHDGVQQTGPFTLTQVQTMLRTGTITQEFQYWAEGLDDWQSVLELSSTPGG
jgi:hypothetical protein